jgi:aldehyde dehydrogenase (NAD+)
MKRVLCCSSIAEASAEYKLFSMKLLHPVLYLLKYSGDVENAIEIQKMGWRKDFISDHDQFTRLKDFFQLRVDCGIGNNIGTSGAEIGGASARKIIGGRESGSRLESLYA